MSEAEFYKDKSTYQAIVKNQWIQTDKDGAPRLHLMCQLSHSLSAAGEPTELPKELATEKELFFPFKLDKMADSIRSLQQTGLKIKDRNDVERLSPMHPSPLSLIGKSVFLRAGHGQVDSKTGETKVWWNLYNQPKKLDVNRWKEYLAENEDVLNEALQPAETPF